MDSSSARHIEVRKRRLQRTGLVLLYFISIASYIAGTLSVFYYPSHIAAETYISENALHPGGAVFPKESLDNAIKLSKDYIAVLKNNQHDSTAPARWIAHCLTHIGDVSVFTHNFTTRPSRLHSFTSHATDNSHCTHGTNVFGTLRAPRGDGEQAVVFVTRYYRRFSSSTSKALATFTFFLNIIYTHLQDASDASQPLTGIGLLLATFSHLRSERWRAKDFILLAVDGDACGDTAVAEWLEEYLRSASPQPFGRAGIILAAVVVDIPGVIDVDTLGTIGIALEGGRLPNLDLINSAVRIARSGDIHTSVMLDPTPDTSLIDRYFTTNVSLARLLGPTAPSYTLSHKEKTLLNFMLKQARGVPTGDHSLFGQQNIDAVTLRAVVGKRMTSANGSRDLGKLVVGMARTLNNLIEQFHQSYYYYLLPDTRTYVSIGYYMQSLGGILLPLLVVILHMNYAGGTQSAPPMPPTAGSVNPAAPLGRDKRSLQALCIVGVFYVVGIIVFLTPYLLEMLGPFIPANVNALLATAVSTAGGNASSEAERMAMLWITLAAVLSVTVWFAIGPHSFRFRLIPPPKDPSSTDDGLTPVHDRAAMQQPADWRTVKTYALLPLLLALSTMSLINFSFSFFASVVTVPVFTLLGRPSRFAVLRWLQLVVLMAVSPPILLMVAAQAWGISPLAIVAGIVATFDRYKTLWMPLLSCTVFPLHLISLQLIWFPN